MSDLEQQDLINYLDSVYFGIQYCTDKQENTPPEEWGINVTSFEEEEPLLLELGWIAENPLTSNCYYLTPTGGDVLNEDVTTPFDKASE